MKKNRALFFILLILALTIPVVADSFTLSQLLAQMCIAIIFALSYNMLLGQCGLLSFGHAIFLGLPAFFTIHCMRLSNLGVFHIPTPFLPIVGGISGLAIAFIVSLFATKKAGATFALITVGINEVVFSSALMFDDFFGSETGVQAMRESFMGITFGSPLEVYYLIFLWTIICVSLMYFFNRTPLGKMANAVRDNPERTSFIGYSPTRIRGWVLVLSGLFAGIAGGLYAITWEQVSYDNVSGVQSALVLFMAYIGGIGYFYGPILGAIFITFFTLYLSAFTDGWMIYLGIFFCIVVLFSPDGLAGMINHYKLFWNAKKMGAILKIHSLLILPIILIMFSCVTIIEILFKWSNKGYSMDMANFSVYGILINAKSIWIWLILIVICLAGSFWFKRTLNITKPTIEQILSQMEIKG